MPLQLVPDAVLRHHDGQWLATNPRTHTHVSLSATAAATLFRLAGGAPESAWIEGLADVHGEDRTCLDLSYGLWSDPSRLGPRSSASVNGAALLEVLRRRWIVCAEGGADYAAALAPLTSLFDRDHVGTFHQVVGQHLALTLRVRDKWRWWHAAKFEADGTALRPGPYRWVQEPFFDAYFAARDLTGEKVLDFACGNGYYGAKLAARGADVVGIDTEAELIALAERNYGSVCRFLRPADPAASLALLQEMPEGSFDRIYMSDILLLLLEPNTDTRDGVTVMAALRRLLRPRGKLHLFEPNPVFWLGCRLGETESPVVVVSEYRQQLYTVAPTLDRVMAVMGEAGFLLAEFIHPDGNAIPAEAAALRRFAESYPLWDFLTFEKPA